MSRSSRSKYLGSLIPELVGIEDEGRLDLLLRMAGKLHSRNPDAAWWAERFREVLHEGLLKEEPARDTNAPRRSLPYFDPTFVDSRRSRSDCGRR